MMKLNKYKISGFLLLLIFLLILILSLGIGLQQFRSMRFSYPNLLGDLLISGLRVTLITIITWLVSIFAAHVFSKNESVKSVFMPVVNFIRHISPFAWLPFAIIWFGLGEQSLIFIMFIALFFPTLIGCISIYDEINRDYIDEGNVCGANKWQIFFYIELPLSLPALINLFRIIWGLGWSTIIAAEMLGVKSGLGFRLLDFRYLLKYPEMLIYLTVMGIFGVGVDSLLRRIVN
ncbi:MAG: ABC transporter permease subunit, partial [Candidatus Cloacimonadota bacterium]|nr:ABC transporter permease subunit [Candidatus Cloacimonadota bacterium]